MQRMIGQPESCVRDMCELCNPRVLDRCERTLIAYVEHTNI